MKYVLFIFLFGLIFRLGFFYFLPGEILIGQQVTFETTLTDDPKIQNGYQHFQVRMGNFWHSTSVFITAPLYPTYSYGQTLSITGTMKESLLKNKETVLTISFPQIEAKNSGFLPIFGHLRERIITFCENNFSQPYAGLLVGIIFGIKSLLTTQTTISFRITGLSHIVAASGMNVTLVAGFVFTLLGSLLKRRRAVIASLGGIFVYVLVSGFQASILRAALMGSIAFSSQLFGRQYSGIYTLFIVVILMLFWDPLLLTDVGFQLSILATLGILVMQPLFKNINILGDDIATTLAAQLFTFPIILTTFGQYSLFSLPANLLVLWTIPLIMIVGGVGILIGLLFAPLGVAITSLTIPLLWYVTQVTDFFSSHTTSIQISSLPLAFIVGYYLLLIASITLVKRKKES